MNGPRDYHTEGHKSDRERQIYDIAYMWYLKKKDTKQKQTHRPAWRVGMRDRLGVWDRHTHITIFKISNQQGPTVQGGNSAWYSANILNKKIICRRICIYITESLCCTTKASTMLLIDYIPI